MHSRASALRLLWPWRLRRARATMLHAAAWRMPGKVRTGGKLPPKRCHAWRAYHPLSQLLLSSTRWPGLAAGRQRAGREGDGCTGYSPSSQASSPIVPVGDRAGERAAVRLRSAEQQSEHGGGEEADNNLSAGTIISLGGGAKLVAPRELDFIYHFLDCGTNL